MDKSKLILRTFDGTMKKCIVKPKCTESTVELRIKYYDEENTLKKGTLIFEHVIALDIEINYFDNSVGSELMGFYEIFDKSAKERMIDKIFQNRRDGYLFHGDYNYDPHEENDMINYKEPIYEIKKKLDEYHFYQQQTEGGLFCILANNYKFVKK